MTAAPVRERVSESSRQPAEQRWLVFVHQLPAHPSNGRVKTWRRLQQIGAVPVKHAVYVLPNTAQAAEDFEWLRAEVVALGGQATIFEASSISGVEEKQIIKQFNKTRSEEYARLLKDIKVLSAKIGKQLSTDAEGLRAVRTLGDRLMGTQEKDFFVARGSREVEAALNKLHGEIHRSPPKNSRPVAKAIREVGRGEYQHRHWVTRPRPGVDRFASAWLIRRFIDAQAAFVFADSPDRYPDAVPFDMYQSGGFKHEGDQCTFEVLQERFGIKDTAVRRIGEIVHDLDLKDDRFKHAHRATIGAIVEGLRASIAEDSKLLEQGMVMFEALYQSFQSPKRKSSAKGIYRGER
jgi:hypothetical protein